MTYAAFALPTGHIAFQHVSPAKPLKSGCIMIAHGDPLHLPRWIFAVAERRGSAGWYVPGFQAGQGKRQLCRCIKAMQAELQLEAA